MSATKLLQYLPLTRKPLLSLFGVKLTPELLAPVPMPLARRLLIGFWIIFIASIAYLGLNLILVNGFCGQNFFVC